MFLKESWTRTFSAYEPRGSTPREAAVEKYIWIGVILVVGISLRLLLANREFNNDIGYWRIAADIMQNGGNVYAESKYYNYGPIWFYLLYFLDLIPWKPHVEAIWSLRWKISIFLTLVDLALAFMLARWFGWRAAMLVLLNPIAIVISGYHGQFDNIAILLALIGARLLDGDSRPSVARECSALTIIGLSLMAKHVFFFFPIWLAMKQETLVRKFLYVALPIAVFIAGFIPFATEAGLQGMIDNIILYRSFNNAPFWLGLVPAVFADKLPHFVAYFLALAVCGLLWRKTPPLESALRYCVVAVIFSSAIANQYLAIPVAAMAANWNIGYAVYTVAGGLYLMLSKGGLHWPFGVGKDYYDELVALLCVGLLLHILPSPQEKLERAVSFTKDTAKKVYTWARFEVGLQFEQSFRKRN